MVGFRVSGLQFRVSALGAFGRQLNLYQIPRERKGLLELYDKACIVSEGTEHLLHISFRLLVGFELVFSGVKERILRVDI